MNANSKNEKLKNGQNSEVSQQAGKPNEKGQISTSVTFEQQDYELFMGIETLPHKAGVPERLIPRLVVKELVDNAYDNSNECNFGLMSSEDGFYVEDDGDGLPGTDEDVARMFSVNRPLSTSKLWRQPTRGAMGNGLRVVAAAVYVSNGSLVVKTGGRSLELKVQDDGTTKVLSSKPWSGHGTRVEVCLGGWMGKVEDNIFLWAGTAKILANSEKGEKATLRPSFHLHSADSLFKLFRAAKGSTVREVIEKFDGCSHAKASEVAGDFLSAKAAEISRDEGNEIWNRGKNSTKPPTHARLGKVGKLPSYQGYKSKDGFMSRAGVHTPYRIEVWSMVDNEPSITVCINRTPCTTHIGIVRSGNKGHYQVQGGNIRIGRFKCKRSSEVRFLVNIICPNVPITSDGKAPDLGHFKEIAEMLEQAAKTPQVKATKGTGVGLTQKDVILANLATGIDQASGGAKYVFSIRQLFYAIRPFILDRLDIEPNYDTFADIIRDHEGTLGHDIPGIYRDNRGTLYIPHSGETVTLGTLSVKKFQRPSWMFNSVLYCEKEGFFPLLDAAQWPEKHDCALLTSKGFATYAVRDMLDLLSKTGEPLTIYCIHDADGYGTMIYQSLQAAKASRPDHCLEIINLGLDPWQAVEMNLPVEPMVKTNNRAIPVADYVVERSPQWKEWLQTQRTELNSIYKPENFIAWLDSVIEPYENLYGKKVIPPVEVIETELAKETKASILRALTAQILKNANIEGRVEEELAKRQSQIANRGKALTLEIKKVFEELPERSWRQSVQDEAAEIAKD